MRKIAIIFSETKYDNYVDDYQIIVSKITDFTEVDNETYNLLNNNKHLYDFMILEQPTDQKQFINDTVEEIAEKIRQVEIKKAERRATEEKKKADRALKRKAKDDEQEKRLLATLIQKHGVPSVEEVK